VHYRRKSTNYKENHRTLVPIKEIGLDITLSIWSCRDNSQFLWKGGSVQYMGTALTNQNTLQEKIQCRLNSGNACCHSVQNFYLQFAPKNIKININWNMTSSAVLCGYETVSLTLREKCRVWCLGIWCWWAYVGLRGKKFERSGESYIMRRWMICTSHQTLFGWSNGK